MNKTTTTLKPEMKYCAFIDVLGYGDIVTAPKRNTDKKMQMLESVYRNLQSSISQYTLKRLKEKFNAEHELYVKSFSDCVFIQSDEPYTILFSLYNIFSVVFGYYTNFLYDEHCTVLLRGGIVRDWTTKIMDLGSLSRHPVDEMPNEEELQNIIGLGVARAYYTSEKSGLSGMRIIISPEVLKSFEMIPFKEAPFECYYVEGDNLLYSPDLPMDSEKLKVFFLPVKENERREVVNLFELCWPVYKYSFTDGTTDIHTFINEILKIEPQYKKDNVRHLKGTAELLYKSFEIAIIMAPNAYEPADIEYVKDKLKSIYLGNTGMFTVENILQELEDNSDRIYMDGSIPRFAVYKVREHYRDKLTNCLAEIEDRLNEYQNLQVTFTVNGDYVILKIVRQR